MLSLRTGHLDGNGGAQSPFLAVAGRRPPALADKTSHGHHARDTRAEVKAVLRVRVAAHLPFARSAAGRHDARRAAEGDPIRDLVSRVNGCRCLQDHCKHRRVLFDECDGPGTGTSASAWPRERKPERVGSDDWFRNPITLALVLGVIGFDGERSRRSMVRDDRIPAERSRRAGEPDCLHGRGREGRTIGKATYA